MVVDDRAVQTWFSFSSAWLPAGTLANPRATRPKVHLFTFILFLLRSVVDGRLMHCLGQNQIARAQNDGFVGESYEKARPLTTVFGLLTVSGLLGGHRPS